MKKIVACLRTFSLFTLTVLFTQCQFTLTTKPDFNVNGEDIIEAIQSKYEVEAVEVTKSEQSGEANKKMVTIKLINGQRLPTEDKLYETGGEVVTYVRNALQHPEEFNSFKVMFVTKEDNVSHSTGFEYSVN